MQTGVTTLRDTRQEKIKNLAMCVGAAAIIIALAMILIPAFAADNYVTDIKDILDDVVNIMCTIFQAVGVLIAVFGICRLILALKNEDSNSQSAATTQMVVGIVLIAIPGLVKGLDLVNRIG